MSADRLAFVAVPVALSLVSAAVVSAGVGGAAGAVLVGALVLLAPGLAFVGHLDERDPVMVFVLAVAMSLVVSLAVAQGMVWLHAWHPDTGALLIAGITALLALAQLGRRRRDGRPEVEA